MNLKEPQGSSSPVKANTAQSPTQNEQQCRKLKKLICCSPLPKQIFFLSYEITKSHSTAPLTTKTKRRTTKDGIGWNPWAPLLFRMVGQMRDAERVTVKKPRKRSYYCQHKWTYKDYPECPRWHQTALRLASITLVFLVATVIGLAIHVSHLSVHSLSDKHNKGILGNNESRCCGCMDISPGKQQQDKIDSTGKSCPDDWFQKQGKCYKFYMNFTSWIDSKISCAVRKSRLLVIQDKAELISSHRPG
ncbi:killer cell lectin-like receptor subfamily F member 1 isoform X4 [Peromyscus maniculatus bairdii]|uniref:killer cell lectin-like receptor subfamily F member 1 isoform X4 n=1 Tax=Peromyscus maniculatus bairdii TaxID=230844 RepID=UPI003FD014D3